MGRWHARSIHESEELELAAVCDIDESQARELAEKFPEVRVYADFTRMLADVEPEIVTLAVPNVLHAALTVQAAEAGVRGICCEKPMAVDLREARSMLEACRRQGAHLIINHQRRTLPSLVRMRDLIREGAIGDVYLLRGTCSGDLLTDGTHLVDSLLHLAGDEDAAWVFGALYRRPPPEGEPRSGGFYASGGYRYGHPVETGAIATWEFRSGLRAEILTGELRFPGREYNDYEVLGSRGRLWRTGDREQPGVYLQTTGTEGWEPIQLSEAEQQANPVARNYDLLARNIRAGGGDHPLSGERALRGLEILMAIFESARLRARIELPLSQGRFPLEVMLEEGQL
jgi:predicted dehydrogenase